MRQAFIGVDVGTSSARPACSTNGARCWRPPPSITVWHEAGNVVEQSSSEIWSACIAAVRTAMTEAACRRRPSPASASMRLLAGGGRWRRRRAHGQPSGDRQRNVIVWMDHRATAEARAVNDTQTMSCAMSAGRSRRKWRFQAALAEAHLPSTYDGAGHFFDLADFLSFKATARPSARCAR